MAMHSPNRVSGVCVCRSTINQSVEISMRAESQQLPSVRLGYRVHPARCMLAGLVLLGPLACNDLSGLAGSQSLPSGTPNPSVYKTAAGALALYQTTVTPFQPSYASTAVQTASNGTFVDYVLASGMFTDELQEGNTGATGNNQYYAATPEDVLDARQSTAGGP